MRTISAGLQAALDTGQWCFLLKIECVNGDVYAYTDHPVNLVYDGVTYVPSPGMERVRSITTDDTKVSEQKVRLAKLGDFADSELNAGLFDNALFTLMKVAYNDIAQGVDIIDKNRLAVGKWNENSLVYDIHDKMRNLKQNIVLPVTPNCRHIFGSQFDTTHVGACTLNVASYTFSSSITTIVNNKMEAEIASTGQVDTYFSNGQITWLTGDNAGLSSPIKTHTVGGTESFILFRPTIFPMQVGDTFDVVAGCDKTFATCQAKFSNGSNFGGMPFLIPDINRR